MGQLNTYNPTYCEENKEATGRTNYILDTLSTEYTQQALFTHASRIFRRMCWMQVSKSA